MKVTLSIIILFFLTSCGQKQNEHKWQKKWVKGLEGGARFEDMVFQDSLNGFLLGSYAHDYDFTNSRAMIYKTNNGGKSWLSSDYGRGEFKKCAVVNDTLFALKKKAFFPGEQDTTEIYVSSDKGNSWNKISSIPYPGWEIVFLNSKIGFIAGEQLFKTTDGGITWYPITKKISSGSLKFNEQLVWRNLIITGDTLFSSNGSNILDKLSIYNDSICSEKLSFDIKLEKMEKDNKNNIWLLGNIGEDIVILERKNFNKYEVTKFRKDKDPYITNFHVSNNNIAVILVYGATILGASHKFYFSADKGKTWREEQIPSNLYVEPVAFYGDNKVWTYSGSGSIQWRE